MDFKRNKFFTSPIMDPRSTSYNICIPKYNNSCDNKTTLLNSTLPNFHIAFDLNELNGNGGKIETINNISNIKEKNYQTMSTSLPTTSTTTSTKFPKFNFSVFSGLLANIINTIPFSLYNNNGINRKFNDSNMFYSAPNIYLDIITNKLEFPENKETVVDKMLPPDNKMNEESKPTVEIDNSLKASSSSVLPDIDVEDKNRKRTKSILKSCPQTQNKIEMRNETSSFNPQSLFNKSKILNKNRKEKNRNAISFDINEDVKQYDSDSDIEIIDDRDFYITLVDSKFDNDSKDGTNITTMDYENFPILPSPSCLFIKDENRRNMRQRQISECDSEDSFVVFSDDVSKTTPTHKNNNSLAKLLLCRRRRQISECSEDSIVFEHDDNTLVDENSEFEYSDDSDEEEEDDEEEEEEEKVQFESGFDEKKVRFNPTPDVHVMRMWDYAYRQARIGKWEEAARDRERFKTRISIIEKSLAPIFDKKLRDRIYKERFLDVKDC